MSDNEIEALRKQLDNLLVNDSSVRSKNNLFQAGMNSESIDIQVRMKCYLVLHLLEQNMEGADLRGLCRKLEQLPEIEAIQGGAKRKAKPAVWEKVWSSKHKHYYYWNSKTGKSTWTKPANFKKNAKKAPKAKKAPQRVAGERRVGGGASVHRRQVAGQAAQTQGLALLSDDTAAVLGHAEGLHEGKGGRRAAP